MLVEQREAIALPGTAPEPLAVAPSPTLAWVRVAEDLHGSARHFGVFAVDCLLVVAAVVASGGSRPGAAAAALAFVATGCLTRLYGWRSTIEAQGVGWYLRRLPLSLLAVGGALALTGHGQVRNLLAPLVTTAAVLVVVRSLAWLAVAGARRRHLGLRDALAIGTPEWLRQLQRRVAAYPEAGLCIAAVHSPSSEAADAKADELRVRRLLQTGAVRQIVFASEGENDPLIERCMQWCGSFPVDAALVLPAATGPRAGLPRIGDLGVLPLGRVAPEWPRFWSKRLFDIVASALLLALLAPVFATVALAIYLYDRGPVFYRQRRVGLGNRVFMIWKFRSMVQGADQLHRDVAPANVTNGLLFKMDSDPRVTPVGAVIRRLAIDELPQLLNVLRGDMSLVGPRPLMARVDAFDDFARQRHAVRPGMTGWWQVTGGHALAYEDMVQLDLAYIRNWTFFRDLWILLRTIPAIVVRRSAY